MNNRVFNCTTMGAIRILAVDKGCLIAPEEFALVPACAVIATHTKR